MPYLDVLPVAEESIQEVLFVTACWRMPANREEIRGPKSKALSPAEIALQL